MAPRKCKTIWDFALDGNNRNRIDENYFEHIWKMKNNNKEVLIGNRWVGDSKVSISSSMHV